MPIIGSKIDETRIDGSAEKLYADMATFRNMGIAAAELPVHGLDVILNGRMCVPRLDEVRDVLNRFDFRYSIHSPNPLNLMDRKDAGLHAAVLQCTLECARTLFAKVVVYHAGRFVPEEEFALFPARDLTWKEKAHLMEKEALLLQSVSKQYPDVCIAIENARPYLSQSPYTYGENIELLRDQVTGINRHNVRINLDFGHLYMTSGFYGYDPVEAVSAIRHLVVHTHIHDNFGGTVHHWEKQQTHQLPFGKGDSHMPVGWGTLPIKDILAMLMPDYSGLFMMELRSRYFNRIEESKQNLEKILTDLSALQPPGYQS